LAVEAARKDMSLVGGNRSPSDVVRYGDALLRAGKTKEAIDQFENYLRLRPESRAYLWQYGIALFFEGRYGDGRRLFEAHRKVNPNDVENAAWHFLCIAKDAGLDEARAEVLPAPGDPRPPMEEILERLAGGDSQSIEDAINAVPVGPRRVSAEVYGHLYLALIADAEGDDLAAQNWIQQAARTPLTHYMADIARVYAERLQEDAESTK
jgi:lipoprotein NlpI